MSLKVSKLFQWAKVNNTYNMKHNLIIIGLSGIILKLLLTSQPSIFIEHLVIGLLILLLITFISKKSNTQQKWKM